MDKLCVAILAILLLGGCGTIMNHGQHPTTGQSNDWVYGGILFDIEATGEGLVFFIVDLPFSLVADTIMLPYTFYMALGGKEADPVYQALNSDDPQLLEQLGEYRDRYVRRGVANNRHTPVATLQKLLDDSDGVVNAMAEETLREVHGTGKREK